MTWGDEGSGDTSQLKTELLPDSEMLDFEHSEILGVGAANPELMNEHEGGGLQSVGPSSGKTAWRRRLSPHHRRAVKTFFTKDQ